MFGCAKDDGLFGVQIAQPEGIPIVCDKTFRLLGNFDQLLINSPISYRVDQNNCVVFRLNVKPNVTYIVTLQSTIGDADLYVVDGDYSVTAETDIVLVESNTVGQAEVVVHGFVTSEFIIVVTL